MQAAHTDGTEEGGCCSVRTSPGAARVRITARTGYSRARVRVDTPPVRAIHRRVCLRRLDPRQAFHSGDFPDDLRLDSFGELVTLANSNHERSGSSHHAIPVVQVEILQVAKAGRALEHDRQAVDRDALCHGLVARQRWDSAVAVRTIAGDVENAPKVLVSCLLEQPSLGRYRSRDRGLEDTADRRLR